MKRLLSHSIVLALVIGLASCALSKGVLLSYNTLTYRAQATLQFDEHEYGLTCVIQNWHNTLLIASLQPLAGVELARLEATADSVWVFDKMNRKYAVLSYEQIGQYITPAPSLKMMQDFIQGKGMPDPGMAEKEFLTDRHRLAVRCEVKEREYNALGQPTRLRLDRYQRVHLKELLPL